jgi:twitching motility protein PilT
MGGSDLHLKVPAPPTVRAGGLLTYLEGFPPLRTEDTAAILRTIMPEAVAGESEGAADFSLSLPEVGRFRVNAFTQRGSASIDHAPHTIRGAEVRGRRPARGDLAPSPRGAGDSPHQGHPASRPRRYCRMR